MPQSPPHPRSSVLAPRAALVAALVVALVAALAPAPARARRAGPIRIVASIGPTSSDAQTVRKLVRSGVSRFRLNMAHQDGASARQAFAAIRAGAGPRAQILCDLPGGKLRTATMPTSAGRINLRRGAPFVLRYGDGWGAAERSSSAGGTWVDYDAPAGVTVGQYARPGGTIWLHQGKITLEVTRVTHREIHTRVVKGGKLGSRGSLALMGQDPTFPELTEADRRKLAIAVKQGATHIGASMIQRASQVESIRRELTRLGAPHTKIVAKIETLGAMEPRTLAAIARSADEVMVARGDLGVALEGNVAALHRAERRIAATCRRYGKPVMNATGFLSGMRTHGAPSVANLLDIHHTRTTVRPDSILLKGTAINADPVAPVRTLRRALTGKDHAPQLARLSALLAQKGGQARAGDLARSVGLSRSRLRRVLHSGRRLGLLEPGKGQLVRLRSAVLAQTQAQTTP